MKIPKRRDANTIRLNSGGYALECCPNMNTNPEVHLLQTTSTNTKDKAIHRIYYSGWMGLQRPNATTVQWLTYQSQTDLIYNDTGSRSCFTSVRYLSGSYAEFEDRNSSCYNAGYIKTKLYCRLKIPFGYDFGSSCFSSGSGCYWLWEGSSSSTQTYMNIFHTGLQYGGEAGNMMWMFSFPAGSKYACSINSKTGRVMKHLYESEYGNRGFTKWDSFSCGSGSTRVTVSNMQVISRHYCRLHFLILMPDMSELINSIVDL